MAVWAKMIIQILFMQHGGNNRHAGYMMPAQNQLNEG
jgi:hypothetical protein